MSRDDGFAVADFATSHFDDPKVKALCKALAPDVDRICRALTLHEAIVLVSWREGRRVTAEDAAPIWLLDFDAPADDLRIHKLLDDDSKLPVRSWRKWYGAANKRRNALRAGWRKRDEKRRSRTKDTTDSRVSHAPRPSVRPSVPSDPSPRGRARGLSAVKDVLDKHGLTG